MSRRAASACRRATRPLLFSAALAALTLAGTVALGERPHVVILGPSADHVAVVRMRGELSMLGIDVDVIVHARPRADLEAIARRLGAVAAMRVETSPAAIVLWVDPAVAAPGVGAEVRVGGAAEEKDPALLALRAVEVLRARLVKVPLVIASAGVAPDAGETATEAGIADAGPADAQTAADAATEATALSHDGGAPGDDVETTTRASDAATGATPRSASASEAPAPHATPTMRAHAAGVSAAAAALLSPGGVPPSLEIRVGAIWDPIPRLGLEAMAFFPATAGTAMTTDGSVDLRVFAFGGGLRGVVTDPAAPFSLAFGLGVDAVLLAFAGKADAPLVADSGSKWAVAPYLSATAAYRLHPMVALRLDVLAAIVRPEPVLRVANVDVATFGLPAVLPSLGIEVRP